MITFKLNCPNCGEQIRVKVDGGLVYTHTCTEPQTMLDIISLDREVWDAYETEYQRGAENAALERGRTMTRDDFWEAREQAEKYEMWNDDQERLLQSLEIAGLNLASHIYTMNNPGSIPQSVKDAMAVFQQNQELLR